MVFDILSLGLNPLIPPVIFPCITLSTGKRLFYIVGGGPKKLGFHTYELSLLTLTFYLL
jgi:hypothetical protein